MPRDIFRIHLIVIVNIDNFCQGATANFVSLAPSWFCPVNSFHQLLLMTESPVAVVVLLLFFGRGTRGMSNEKIRSTFCLNRKCIFTA